VVTAENLAEFEPEDYPTRFFSPTAGHLAGAVGFVALGLGITLLVARLGRED
jgi:hypothetical protein